MPTPSMVEARTGIFVSGEGVEAEPAGRAEDLVVEVSSTAERMRFSAPAPCSIETPAAS